MKHIRCPFCHGVISVGVQGKPELLTSAQVAARLSMSVRTLWRLVALGKFPQPIHYNRKLVRWKAEDIEQYMRDLA